MPEGPEVLQLANDLKSRILNKYLIGAFDDGNSRYKNERIPGINLLVNSIHFVQKVFTKGKHIFIELIDYYTYDYKIYMEIRFGNAGRLALEKNKHCNISLMFCESVSVTKTLERHMESTIPYKQNVIKQQNNNVVKSDPIPIPIQHTINTQFNSPSSSFVTSSSSSESTSPYNSNYNSLNNSSHNSLSNSISPRTSSNYNSESSSIFTFVDSNSYNYNTNVYERHRIPSESNTNINNSFQSVITSGEFYIYFEDHRHQGAVEFKSRNELDTKLKKLGPDLLSESISYDQYSRIFYVTAKRNPEWQICQFLMDQSKLSGIGNYLKADVLYLCRIRPDRLLKNISEQDVINLYNTSIGLIKEAFQAGGLTIKNFYTIDGEVGLYNKRIYGRKYDVYGNQVIKTELKDKRTTHWVPAIQI